MPNVSQDPLLLFDSSEMSLECKPSDNTYSTFDSKSSDGTFRPSSPPPPPSIPLTSRGTRSIQKHGQLYGREKEIEQLREAFERRRSGINKSAPELFLVAGKSGTGKSVLVKRALKEVAEDHEGFFVVGKFDQQQTPEPYGPFAAALTQLVMVLQQNYGHTGDDL